MDIEYMQAVMDWFNIELKNQNLSLEDTLVYMSAMNTFFKTIEPVYRNNMSKTFTIPNPEKLF